MQPVIIAKGSEPEMTEALADTELDGEEQSIEIPGTLPILPVRNPVLFPGTILPITISRPGSRKLLEESLPHSKIIGLFTQTKPGDDEPGPEDLARVGVAASVLKYIRQADDQVVIIVNTLDRIAIRMVLLTEPFIKAEVEVLSSTEPPSDDKE